MFPKLKSQFMLDPETIFLNHGSFGACAKPMYENLIAWQKKLEKELYETSGLSELAKQLNEHQDKIKTILTHCFVL